MTWEIGYYLTPGGQDVIEHFIDSLQTSTQTKLGRQLDLLEENGNHLGMPHARHMGGGLLELRVRGSQEVRVFYTFTSIRQVYLLHGFVKKSQATPTQDINIARRRKLEVDRL